MGSVEYAEQLSADTWGSCDTLGVYGEYFATPHICPHPPPDRKFRLMVAAALRAVWDHIADPHVRAAVESAERHADAPDAVSDDSAGRAVRWSGGLLWPDAEGGWLPILVERSAATIHDALRLNELRPGDLDGATWVKAVTRLESDVVAGRTHRGAKALHLQLFHDLFPNPFRPVAFDPSWRTEAAVGLAGRMYESREFGVMPILADALEEAGCDSPDILTHCRGDGPHARGCWVVDLVLGNE